MAGFSKSPTNATPMAVRDICRVIWLDGDALLHTSSHTSHGCTLICYRARNEDSSSNANIIFQAYLTMVSGESIAHCRCVAGVCIENMNLLNFPLFSFAAKMY